MHTQLKGGRPRRVCTACHHIHFTDPKVGVGVLVFNEQHELLLVRRAVEPGLGRWSVPAGYLDHGDDPQISAEREAREETGLIVRVTDLLSVTHNPPEEGGASIFLLYRASLEGGTLQPGDDADKAAFFALTNLPPLAFRSMQALVDSLEAD